ncbi:YbhB/YbcL family Raf kinase inhibitor-like protein [Lewinella sp. 4G2]|uniref:YbhB/YbcL family Raf kinase inhibitor-like protein n=1 Tax=Lewinella sp. 4G2 TaxID=1803372 RepID=UPI0007B4DAD1|nr:YbhB/YbcL family Raf kinase inhibitor-like protein [Lewinella sp. 4G2]OAV45381.1 hypothetical protein A3850_013155 [Lewinella sp. 4G2]
MRLRQVTKQLGMPSFTLSSSDLGGSVDQPFVYDGFGAGGNNESPALAWTNPPAGTKSFLVTCHDTDAPGPGGWWHWVVFNLPASTSELKRNANHTGLPNGAKTVVNSYGDRDYGGPCPPPGDAAHPYVFTVYALSDELDLTGSEMPAMVLFMADSLILGKSSIVSYYAR